MNKGQRVLTGMLGAVAVMLGVDALVAASSPEADEQAVLPVPAAPEHIPALGSVTAPARPAPPPSTATMTMADDGISDVIRTRRLEIVDDEGRVMIRLGLDAEGQPWIVTANGDGTPLAALGQFNGGGMIGTYDQAGRALVVVTQRKGKGKIIYGGSEEPTAELE